MKGVEFEYTKRRLFSFEDALFLNIIKKCKGVTVFKSIKLRVISSISVTDGMFAFRRVKSTRTFHSILMVISTVMTTIFTIGLSTTKFFAFDISFASPSFRAFSFSTDKNIYNIASAFKRRRCLRTRLYSSKTKLS